MTHSFKLSAAIGFALTLSPALALAHEHQIFEIGDKTYDITIGSLNEPVTVDDKAGVELSIWQLAGSGSLDVAVTGLETTLKVEVQADGQKKIMDLAAAWGEEGSYHAVFYPTVATEYSYRLFGTLNTVPVDLTFTCNPGGHVMSGGDENTTHLKISDQITRIEQRGSFSCPQDKIVQGFPVQASTLAGLSSKVNTAMAFGITGLALGIVALIRSGKKRRQDVVL